MSGLFSCHLKHHLDKYNVNQVKLESQKLRGAVQNHNSDGLDNSGETLN